MSFTRVKPAGFGINGALTSTDLDQLDINASQAVDGTGGGTYTGVLIFEQGNQRINSSFTTGGTKALTALETNALMAVLLPKNPGSDLVFQLPLTGVSTGKTICFFRPWTAHSFACRLERGTSGAYIVQFDSGTLVPTFADVIFDGTTWRVLRSGPNYDNAGTDFTLTYVE